MGDYDKSEISRTDFLIVRDEIDSSIDGVIAANGLQVGLDDSSFLNDLVIKSAIDLKSLTSAPVDTTYKLYNEGGTLKFNGSSIGSDTFKTIAVSGQGDIVADSSSDTLTVAAGSNITITTDSSTDTITFASSGGGGSGGDFFDDPVAGYIVATGSAAFAGGDGATYMTTNVGSDVFFYVSGTIGEPGSEGVDPIKAAEGVSVFGGDVVISGTLFGGSPLKVGSSLDIVGDLNIMPSGSGPALLKNPSGEIKLLAASYIQLGSRDGRIELLDIGDGFAGRIQYSGSGGLSSRMIGINTPGQIELTGSTGGVKIVGGLFSESEIRGSLTRLVDGSSYLIAGGGITITSSSNGPVTITSKAGVRSKIVQDLSTNHDANSPLTITGANFDKASYDVDLIDIYVNGVLLYSGSNKDYILTANQTDQITFAFQLKKDDAVTAISNNLE